jgi:hypothetical protein
MNNLNYISLEHNSISGNNMTSLDKIYPEGKKIKDDFACLHCGKDVENKNKRQLVLNRGIYADYLEPEYYRYNKSYKMNINDVGRKYLQYKPRRPKCPIIYNKLFPEPPKSHLIQNPLYNYPVETPIKDIEKQWTQTLYSKNTDFVKGLTDMMEEYDNAYIQ